VSRDPTATAPGAGTMARQLRAWLPAVAVMAVIFVLSSQPGLRFSDVPAVDLPIRRFAHVAAYGVLAVLLLRPFSVYPSRRAAFAAFILAVLWAASDEMHQALVPDRHGNPGDVAIDAAGALLGLIAWTTWRSRSPSWRSDRRVT